MCPRPLRPFSPAGRDGGKRDVHRSYRMTAEQLEQFSEALAERVAAASFAVAIRTGRRGLSGILWRDDVVVTSDQMLPDRSDFTIVHRGTEASARLAGRDP